VWAFRHFRLGLQNNYSLKHRKRCWIGRRIGAPRLAQHVIDFGKFIKIRSVSCNNLSDSAIEMPGIVVGI